MKAAKATRRRKAKPPAVTRDASSKAAVRDWRKAQAAGSGWRGHVAMAGTPRCVFCYAIDQSAPCKRRPPTIVIDIPA